MNVFQIPLLSLLCLVSFSSLLRAQQTPPATPSTEVVAPAVTAPTTAPATAPIAETVTPSVVTTADEAFDVRMQGLEEQVNDLKEKVLRTKYRLAGLAETVIGGDVNSGAKLALWHRNELGSSYILVAAAYTIDGSPIYTKVDETGDLNEREEFVVFDQRIVPGQHQIAVQYELRGHGYGVFSYLENMRVKLRHAYSFDVAPGKMTKIVSLLREKSGVTLEFKDKPDIQFEMSVTKDAVKPEDTQAAVEPAGEQKK